MSDKTSSPIIVVGAGMNGLLSAYYLAEKGFSVEVYESSSQVGGKIQTEATAFGPRELAANALLVDQEVEAVAQCIGLKLIAKNKAAARRYIWRKGRARQWPLGIVSSFRVFFFLIAQLFKFSFIKPRPREILEDWGHRVLGREATTYFLNPACLGIFAKDSRCLSGYLIYNYFFARRKRARGHLRGSVAPEGGMAEFPQKLRAFLETKGVVFHLQKALAQKPSGPVVLAVDCASAQKLLASWGDSRAGALARVSAVDLFSVNVFYKEPPKSLKPGFGILFPRSEGVAPLGVLFNSYIFSPARSSGPSLASAHSETWIFGGGEDIPLGIDQPGKSDGDFLQDVRQARASILQDRSEPLAGFVNHWPAALPLYGRELEKVLETLPLAQEGVYLMGNYLGELGLNRFFHRARQMAEYFSGPALG